MVRTQRTAIYPGSFDPVTSGHLQVIDRGLRLFDHLTIAVAINDRKSPTSTASARLAALRESLPDDGRVATVALDGLITDYCRQHGIRTILRGARGASDAESETRLSTANRLLSPDIDTMIVPTMGEGYVSSSSIRDVVRNGGSVGRWVHPSVERRLRADLP